MFGGVTAAEFPTDTWAYDLRTDTWTNLSPANHPSGRKDHAMAYDAANNRTILFGGNTVSGNSGETWAYDSRSNTWTNMSPASHPSARSLHSMAYDAASARVILFGGDAFGETWSYDFASNTWTNRTPASHPAARESAAMAYDSAAGRTILFGGFTGAQSHETWSYDFAANAWTNLNPSSFPSGRSSLGLAYDAASGRTVLFGGYTGSGVNGETWTYDSNANAWTNRTPSGHPAARFQHGMAYDSAVGRVILVGGDNNGIPNVFFNDTWGYDAGTNAWANPALRPAGRYQSAMAYDSQFDRVVLFGGYGAGGNLGSYNDDTWLFDPGTNLWANMSPANHPSARYGHAMVYDASASRFVLFGGTGPLVGGNGLSDETWIYDLANNTWTLRSQVTRTMGRNEFGMSDDVRDDRMVMYGGYIAATVCSPDTWEYDYGTNSWTDKTSTIYPQAQCDFAMTYDAKASKTILFGGRPFDTGPLLSATWSFDLALNRWINETPSIPQSPSGRVFSTMAYDSVSHRTILVGGSTT